MCGIGKITVTYDYQPCIFYNKKHQDTHGHNFTMQFTELRMDLEIFLPGYIIYNNETKWSQEACVMKSIIKGNKEKAITISKILNLIYKYMRGRDIFDKLWGEKYCSSFLLCLKAILLH